MKARKTKIVLAAAGLLVVSFIIMRFLIAQKEDIPRRPPAAAERWVSVAQVEYTNLVSPVTARGRVISQAEVEVIAEASGKIEPGEIPLKKGQTFKKGQVLLTISKDEVELALQSQKSSFLKTLANLLPDLKIDFPNYYDSFYTFFNEIDIEKELPPLPSSEGEKLKIFLASRNVLNEYYAIQRAEKALARHTIYAPFNGSYTQVNLQVGAYTNTGGRIATIIKTEKLEIEAPVEVHNAQWIKVGDKVKIEADAPVRQWTGTVSRIADYIQVETQSRPVFIQVPATNSKLFVGEYFSVEFSGAKIQNCMQIPRNAVFNSNQVFIVVDGRLKKREVEVIKVNEKTILFRGLKEGEYVVTQALISAAENAPVKRLNIDERTEQKPATNQ